MNLSEPDSPPKEPNSNPSLVTGSDPLTVDGIAQAVNLSEPDFPPEQPNSNPSPVTGSDPLTVAGNQQQLAINPIFPRVSIAAPSSPKEAAGC